MRTLVGTLAPRVPARGVLAAFATLALAVGAREGSAAPTDFDEEEIVIEGEVLKPEITVLITRENLNKAYELKLDENFLERILESVEHDPF